MAIAFHFFPWVQPNAALTWTRSRCSLSFDTHYCTNMRDHCRPQPPVNKDYRSCNMRVNPPFNNRRSSGFGQRPRSLVESAGKQMRIAHLQWTQKAEGLKEQIVLVRFSQLPLNLATNLLLRATVCVVVIDCSWTCFFSSGLRFLLHVWSTLCTLQRFSSPDPEMEMNARPAHHVRVNRNMQSISVRQEEARRH